MDERVENTLLTEIFVQCEIGLIHARELEQAAMSGDAIRIWSLVQAFLVASANISKMLWPSGKNEFSVTRGRRIRELLGVPDDHVLKHRKFRNHFEHLDERLDRWASHQTEGETYGLLDGFILHGSINVLEKPERQMRIFDARELTVMFYGEKYPLRPVVTAIQALQSTIQQVARQRLEAKKTSEGRASMNIADPLTIG